MSSRLELLLEKNLDGYESFEYLSHQIENENFRNFSSVYAKMHLRFANQLKIELKNLNIKFKTRTIYLGELHQSLMKILNSSAIKDEKASIDKCIRNEQDTITMYEKVIRSDNLDLRTLKMLSKQINKIKAGALTLSEMSSLVSQS